MAKNNLDWRYRDDCENNEEEWVVCGMNKFRKKNRILELIVVLLIKDKEVLLKKEQENSEGNMLQENNFWIGILQEMSANLLNNNQEKSLKYLCGLLKSIGSKVKCEDVDLKNVLDEMEEIVKAPCKERRSFKERSQKRLPIKRVELKPAHFLKNETLSDEDKKTENLYIKVMSILNNLTIKNFHTLVNQVRKLQIDTKERMQGVIELIFDKAINEPMYSVAYAKMCKELQFIQVPAINDNSDDKEGVAEMQMEFEKQSVDETIINTMVKEVNECSDTVPAINDNSDDKKGVAEMEMEFEKQSVYETIINTMVKEINECSDAVSAINDNSDDKKEVAGIEMKFEKQSVDETIINPMVKEINECNNAVPAINDNFDDKKGVAEMEMKFKKQSLDETIINTMVPATNSSSVNKKGVAFRTLLVTRCQIEFEKQSVDETIRNTMVKEINDCSDAEKKKELSFELEKYDMWMRTKSVGCVRFIGELFKQQMLTASIIGMCLQTLLDNKDEESLECLCTLLTTVGKKLVSMGIDLSSAFVEIKNIVEGKGQEVSSRIRLMLQDVIDLRDSKWPRKGRKSGEKSSQKGLPMPMGKVELRWSTNPWRPARFLNSDTLSDEEEKADYLYRKVRSVLNKLTLQKFDTLVNQVKELQIDTKERLQTVVNLVVDKAIKEPLFSVLYAMMCKELQGMQVPAIDDNSDDKKGVAFRNILFIRCQMEFEKPSVDETIRNKMVIEINECSDAEKLEELSFRLEEYDKQQRVKSVNFIRFIGELFKQQMFTDGIMRRCLRTLLDKKDEESLECLCKLLTTVGKELDFEGMDRCLQTLLNKKDEKSLEYSCKLLTTVGKELDLDLTSIFDEMKKIVEGKRQKVCSRIRFMLQDVIGLKNSKWIPRRAATDLKTIDQIQKELNRNKLRKDVKGRRSREGGNQQKDTDVDWRSVGGDNRPAFTKQTEKIRAAKQATSMMSLVPPSPHPNTGPGNMQTTQLIPQAGQPLNNYQRTAPEQRRAIAIPIIDPYTGQIFDENNSHPASGESSPRQTPCPAPPNKEVQAAFAKQVAQAIMEDRQSSSSVATEQPLLHEPSPPEHFQPPSQSMPSIASSEPLDDISCTPS